MMVKSRHAVEMFDTLLVSFTTFMQRLNLYSCAESHSESWLP